MNSINYAFDHYPLTNIELRQMIDICALQFEQMKKDNESLFQESQNIREMDSNAVFPLTYDIEMDDEEVFVISINEYPYLGTSGLATCFAVTAKGETEDNEIYIGLAHINLIPVKEVLEEMTKSFRQNGCSEESIEFYIIGGMLPNDKPLCDTYCAFDKEKEFIALKDEYNIKSVYFNHINDPETSLSVVMTKDGAQWTTRENAFSLFSESWSSSSADSTSEEDSDDDVCQVKRKRSESSDDEYYSEKKSKYTT